MTELQRTLVLVDFVGESNGEQTHKVLIMENSELLVHETLVGYGRDEALAWAATWMEEYREE